MEGRDGKQVDRPSLNIVRDRQPRRHRDDQFQRLSLEQEAIYRSGDLPRGHSDPFDRLLAAQAIGAGMTLISPGTCLSLLGASRLW